MTHVYTPAGLAVQLGEEIARGGEAKVLRLPELPEEVAKIYLRVRDTHRDKLQRMLDSPPSDPTRVLGHASIAWPSGILIDDRRRFVGYRMPYIRDAVPLVAVFNPRQRAAILPAFDERYLMRAARNLASAIDALHARDYVVGDLNERNVLVTPRALISVIDADSIQVQDVRDGHIVVYPCPVGRAEYTPPELQGRQLAGVLRRPEHDRFGLAVLIFQLLMAGSHPFRARWTGSGDPPPVEKRIGEGWFPYASGTPTELQPPPGAPQLEALDPELAGLFRACFVEGHAVPSRRPTASAWSRALAAAEEQLTPCRNGHYFSNRLPRCPTCQAGRAGIAGRGRRRPPGPAEVPATTAAGTGVARSSSPSTAVAPAVRKRQTAPAMAAQRMAAAAAWPFVAPMRAARRTAEAWRRWRRSFAAGLRVLPIVAAATLLSSRRRRALVDAWRPVQARIVWTSGMAVLAGLLVCLVAGGLRLAASAGVQAAVWPVQSTPALAAMVSGVAGLVVAGVFTDLARWPNRRVSGAMLRSAGLRAALAACGWVLGWAVALAVLGVTGATAGLSASPPGWSVTWAVYGAIGGIVGGAGQHGGSRQLYWAMAGAAFGTVGYAVTRLAAALLAGGR